MRMRNAAIRSPQTKTRHARTLCWGKNARIAMALLSVLSLLVASMMLTGCGRRNATEQPSAPSVTATGSPSEATGTGQDRAQPGRMDVKKAEALDKELSSIDEQLGDVQMPDDTTFNGAAAALE